MGIRTCYCDLHSRRWGPGGDKIPTDFGSSPDSECSNPPPPASCTVGILRSACACPAARVCRRVVGGAWGVPMMGLAGQRGGAWGRWESESHQPMLTMWSPTQGPACCLRTWHGLIYAHIYRPGLKQPSRCKRSGLSPSKVIWTSPLPFKWGRGRSR